MGGRWHGPHSIGEETEAQREASYTGTPCQKKERGNGNPHSFCTWGLCTCCSLCLECLSLPSSLGRFSPWRLPTKVISSRKTSLSSQAHDPLRLSFVEPITVMTSSAEGVYSQSVPSTNPGAPAGRWPHPPHSFCVQHPAWVQGTMELSTSLPNQWLHNL